MQTGDDRDRIVDRSLGASIEEVLTSAGAECLDAEQFAAWQDGGLEAVSMQRIEDHMSSCARCQAMAAAFVRADASSPVAARSPWTLRWLMPVVATAAAALTIWILVPRPPGVKLAEQMAMGQQTTLRDFGPGGGGGGAPLPTGTLLPATPATDELARSKAVEPQDASPAGRDLASPARRDLASPAGRDLASPAARDAASPAARDAASTERRDAASTMARSRSNPPAAQVEAPPAIRQEPRPAAVAPPTLRQEQAAGAAPPPPSATATEKVDVATESPLLDLAGTRTPTVVVEFASSSSPVGPGGLGGAPRGGGGRGVANSGVVGGISAPPPVPVPPTRWRAFTDGRVERSVTNGGSWETITIDRFLRVTNGAAPSPLICWLVGPAGVVLRTTDGLHFDRLAFPEATDLTAVQATSDRVATVTTRDGRTFATNDGGASWRSR